MRIANALLLALLFLAAAWGPARAQCTIAAYADPAGTQSLLAVYTEPGVPFSFYVVMFTEDTATAMAYDITISGLGSRVLVSDRIIGPSGNGLVLDEDTGTNIALTECVYGFGSAPILVAEYVLVPLEYAQDGTVEFGPNLSQGPTPVYVTCTNVKKPCDPGPTFYYYSGLPNESTSFGAIKSLYQR